MTFLRQVTDEQIQKEKKKLTHISLFTGIGGFDLGMAQAGFESRVMVEYDKHCVMTLKANWHWEELKKREDHKGNLIWKNKTAMRKQIKHYHTREPVILQEDIIKLTTKRILEAGDLQVGQVTVVTGGPPCQGFSTAGKRIIEDPRNKLFKEFVRVVREALPVFFILENVPGMVSIAKGEIIKQICEEFANSGYNVTWDILNAADYGVPQNRKRVIMIGRRIDVMRFPEEGNPQLHMGAMPGKIDHPEKFREKHGMVKKGQSTLENYKEPTTIIEFMQQLNRKR